MNGCERMIDFNSYIDALLKKDDEAFSIVYNETKHAVFSIIFSITKSRVVSEDIMQDTYITMLEKLHLFNKKNKFTTWLLTIARNKAIDYYRSNKREVLVDINDFENYNSSNGLSSEDRILVSEMLNCLSDVERTVFLLKIMNNLKSREIAKILDLPLGTVLWHYNNASKKIKKIGGGSGIETKR